MLTKIIVIVIVLQLVFVAIGYQPGEEVSTTFQVIHAGLKTQWSDLAVGKMPKYRIPEELMLEFKLPLNEKVKGSEYVVQVDKNVALSLAFDSRKLILPRIKLYDAEKRKSLRELIVTFTHDEFEIVKVQHEMIYHPVPKTVGVHPSLRTFEVKYRWVSVQEEDFAFGVQIMFVGAVIGFLILFCVVIYNSEFGSGGHTLKSSGKKVTSSKVK